MNLIISYFVLFLYVFRQPIFEVVQDNFLQMGLIDRYNVVYIHHQYFQQLKVQKTNQVKTLK
jgi:hypothetical protein